MNTRIVNYTSEHTAQMGTKHWKIGDVTDSVLVTLAGADLPKGWHFENFTEDHKVAKDSGGFELLMNPSLARSFDVDALISKHIDIGYGPKDTIISADFPISRAFPITSEEALQRQTTSTQWYNRMKLEIPLTVPVVHGRDPDEMENHLEMYELDEKQEVCMGSNLAEAKARVYDHMKKGGQVKAKKGRPSTTKLWLDVIEMMKVVRNNEREVFLLGAGGMNAAPIAALLGATSVDATSWRLNAMMRKIFCTDHGRYIRVGMNPNYEQDWAKDFLEERLQDENYPFAGMTFEELIRAFHLRGAAGTEVCKLHNIYELDRDAQRISDYAGDPDGLASMLTDRFHSTWKDSNNLRVLDAALASIKSDASVAENISNLKR